MTAGPSRDICPRCSSPVRTHHVCGVCGYYRGRPVVEIEG